MAELQIPDDVDPSATWQEGGPILVPDEPDENGQIVWRRGLVKKVHKSDKGDTLQVEIEDEHGKTSGPFSHKPGQGQRTNERSTIEQCKDLCELPVFTNEAIIDALRCNVMANNSYACVRNMLVVVNPFKDSGKTSVKIAQQYQGGSLPPEEFDKPHIFNTCAKVQQMSGTVGSNVCIVLRGDSGAGKTETARHIVRYFTSPAFQAQEPNSQVARVNTALKSAQPILQAFGNAKTMDNDNSSRFGLHCQMYMGGAEVVAGRLSPFLLEISRVANRGVYSTFNFSVFYDMLHGLRTDQREEIHLKKVKDYPCLHGDAGSFGSGGHGHQGKSSFHQELVPALESIGITHKMEKHLWSCLGGILNCSCIEWAEANEPDESSAAMCSKPHELREVARLFGVPEEGLLASLSTTDRQARGVRSKDLLTVSSAEDRTMNLACAIYGEIFNWLVRRLNSQLGAPGADTRRDLRWISFLDMFGFENLVGKSHINSLEQLLINLADEQLNEWFLTKLVDSESEALQVQAFAEGDASQIIKDAEAKTLASKSIMELVAGSERVQGMLSILEKTCSADDDEEKADGEFLDSCDVAFSRSYEKVFKVLSAKQVEQTNAFMIKHSAGSVNVEYRVDGFSQKSKLGLEASAIELLASSSNAVMSEVFSFDGIDKEAGIVRNMCFIDQLKELSDQLCSSDVETQFVACVRTNKKAKDGHFDWLAVDDELRRLGVFDMASLQRNAVLFPCRLRHAEFLQEFSALCISTPAQPKRNAREAVNTILKVEAQGLTSEKDYLVTGNMVMMTQECAGALRERQQAIQGQLKSLASEIQKATRASKAAMDATAGRELIIKLQACARRRRDMDQVLADRAQRRKKAVLTLQAHLRTLAQRDAYQEMYEERQKLEFAKLIAGLWQAVQFAKSCQGALVANSATEEVIAPLLTLSLRAKMTWRRTEKSTLLLQNMRRGKLAVAEVAETREEKQSVELLRGAFEAVRMRTSVQRLVMEQKTLMLQSRRRGVQSARQVDDIRNQKQEFAALAAAVQTVCLRWQHQRHRTESASMALQASRRKLQDTRKVDELRSDRDACTIFRSALMTLLYRQAMVTRGTSDIAARLQAQRRAVVDRRRVDKIRTQQDLWNALKGWSTSFLLRTRLINFVTEKASRTLQRFWRVQMARRKVHGLRFMRLQQRLAGAWQSRQAQTLMLRLKQEDILQQNVLLLASAVEAALLRRQHVETREHTAALHIGKVVRGMLARKHTGHLRIVWAQRQFRSVYRVFEARHYLGNALLTHEYRLARDVMQSHFSTLRYRGHFHMFKKHVQATETLQRYARGCLARRRYRRLIWENRASRGQTTIAAHWHRYKAQSVLIEAQWENQVERGTEVLLSVFRTLVARRDHEAYYQELLLNSSAVKLQQHWRGWWWRQHPDVARVQTCVSMVRRELEDAALQRRHAAAAHVQGAWRSWLVRQVRLLPVLISTLTAQRKNVLQARIKETGGLKGFRTTAAATENALASHWMCEYGGAQVVNLSLPIEDTTCFSGWVDVLLALEHRGEVILDMSVGVEHAIVVCVSGRTFVYNDPGTFHDYDAEFREEEFQLAPVMFREPMRVEPNIISVACGDRHALILSDQGVVWAWGWNERGQCGVGRHLPLECYLKMTCLQSWAKKPNPASAQVKSGPDDLPRVTAIACGARHSGIVDAEGAMWMWGEHQGVGLYRVRSANLGQSPAFLLYKFSRGAKDQIRPIEDNEQKPQLTEFQRYLEDQVNQIVPEMIEDQVKEEKESFVDETGFGTIDINSEYKTTAQALKIKEEKAGSLRRMLTDAQKYACIKEAAGDILAPSKCCNLVMCLNTEAARLRAAGTPVIDSFINGWCCPVFAAPARGVRFVTIEFGGDLNAALTEKGYLYTWGKSDQGMLGRKVDVPGKPSVPVRVPLFPQLAISIINLSVGVEHVVALTSHGRVFIWGRVEACMGSEGFCRNTLTEPMFVEGVLRELRIVKVAAGRLESAVTTENFDVLLGFEMLEVSKVGHRLLPVCYQYTMTGPKTGYGEAVFNRLKCIKSQALQMLFVGGATSEYQSHLDPTPDPEGPKLRTGHNFMRKGMGHKQLINPHASSGNNRRARGLATQELFQWSSRAVLSRTPTYTEPQCKIVTAGSVAPSLGRRQRDYLESDKDLNGYRRLAMSRNESDILALDSRVWKIEGYEIEDPQYLDSEVDELSEDEAGNDEGDL